MKKFGALGFSKTENSVQHYKIVDNYNRGNRDKNLYSKQHLLQEQKMLFNKSGQFKIGWYFIFLQINKNNKIKYQPQLLKTN